MAELSTAGRNKLPSAAFALPGRRYPIHDASHARNALARVSQYGTPEEKARVRAAVKKKYPDMGKVSKDTPGADSSSLAARLLREG